ncbi:MAG: hypothetical protein DWQ19_12450 [Crenarchaeota archaeon]|nr:MAG: hypothetical protein DWQ19_12450 [Thermoproteota archaeon]
MLILSILHNIFLTIEEIKQLYEGNDIEVVGVSLPVWYYKRRTSEPAEEVFCKYLLTNKNIELESLVEVKEERDGYQINMPQLPPGYKPRSISNEEWRGLSLNEQLQWYENHPVPKSAKNLLPISEGGAEYLSFKEYGRTLVNNRNIATIHIVEIKTINNLVNSLD